MRRKSHKITVKPTKQEGYNWVVTYPHGGGRKRTFFKHKSGRGGADTFARKKKDEIESLGAKHETVTDAEWSAIIAFREGLESLPEEARNITLMDVVNAHLAQARSQFQSISCRELSNKLIDIVEKNPHRKSDMHLSDIKSRLNRFNKKYGNVMISDISKEDVEEYLNEQSNGARPNFYATLHQLFVLAVNQKVARKNVMKEIRKPQPRKDAEIGILKPKELSRLLEFCEGKVLPAVVISFFAGVRRSELGRLDWSDICFDSTEEGEYGFIEIKAKNAKSSRRRLIPMSENLKGWLLSHRKNSGSVVITSATYRHGLEKAQKLSGVKIPQNGGRHSFASYRWKLEPDKVVIELGHKDSALIYQRYRQLVTMKDAEAYWKIFPSDESDIVNIKSA